MERVDLMQELWNLSEVAATRRDKMLLRIAGNMVESTFTTNELAEALVLALGGEGLGLIMRFMKEDK